MRTELVEGLGGVLELRLVGVCDLLVVSKILLLHRQRLLQVHLHMQLRKKKEEKKTKEETTSTTK